MTHEPAVVLKTDYRIFYSTLLCTDTHSAYMQGHCCGANPLLTAPGLPVFVAAAAAPATVTNLEN